MANQFITTDLVSNTALAMFANNAPFVMTASRIYQDDFVSSGYKIGDTLQVRRQNHFIVGDGSVGPVTRAIRKELFSIFEGTKADRYNWLTPVPVTQKAAV